MDRAEKRWTDEREEEKHGRGGGQMGKLEDEVKDEERYRCKGSDRLS